MRLAVQLPGAADFARWGREVQRQAEKAALQATARASAEATRKLRADMAGRRLGRLGNAIGTTSDQAKGGRVYRTGSGSGFSASGVTFARSKSARTLGALEAYTEGASIRARRGGWLWIASRDIPARIGRERMTPALYKAKGLEQRIGPLVFVQGRNKGEALLIVRKASVSRSGRAGSARQQGKRVSAKRIGADQLVAFIGVRSTARAARVNVESILRAEQARLPERFTEAVEKIGGRRG